jgi:hypothetical protein
MSNQQPQGWAQVWLQHHPGVSTEEANKAWLELRDAGVNVDNTEEIYRAMHERFACEPQVEHRGAKIEGTKVILTPEQRQMARDLGKSSRLSVEESERLYARGEYARQKARGWIND